jgi:dolichol-phosphate mannosyltransferase
MKISLIIPTLNEREAIAPLFSRLNTVARGMVPADTLEVVLVDDASTDGTVAAAHVCDVSFSLRVVERKERGLATAVIVGFATATGEVLGVMDADLSHPPELIPQLVAALHSADLVVGSRHAKGGVVEEWPWYRLYASTLMMQLTRPLGVPVRDPLSGFFFLRRSVIDHVTLSPIGYKILLEILVKGHYKTVREVPYTFRNRGVGKSKMDVREALRYLRHVARLYRWKWTHVR